MIEPTYEEALAHFKAQEIYWKSIVEGVRRARDSKFADLKRNMNTPECNQRADDKVMGAMLALDDILFEFESHNPVDETESQQ